MHLRALPALIALGLAVSAGQVSAAGDAAAGAGKAAMCAACHGPAGASAAPNFPKLAGQSAAYVRKQLADFKGGKRSDPTMAPMALPLGDQDMDDLGAYYAAQPVQPGAAQDAAKAKAGEDLYRGGNKATNVPACMGCHGPRGAGNAPAGFPALAGQHGMYAAKALRDFRSGARGNDMNGMMRDIAMRMTDAEIDAVAEYLSGLH